MQTIAGQVCLLYIYDLCIYHVCHLHILRMTFTSGVAIIVFIINFPKQTLIHTTLNAASSSLIWDGCVFESILMCYLKAKLLIYLIYLKIRLYDSRKSKKKPSSIELSSIRCEVDYLLTKAIFKH